VAEGTSTITNCPDILDVPLMAEVLRGLGATVELGGRSPGSPHPTSRNPTRTSARDANIPASVMVPGAGWSGGASGQGSAGR